MFSPGDIVNDRYRVVRRVGLGGMGQVFEVEDLTKAGRRCALKTILPESGTKTIARFQREYELSRRISHPNVLKIHEVFEHRRAVADGESGEEFIPCMVMEFLAGETLADRLATRGRLSQEEARPLVSQMAAALAAAHRADVVHRDLKPDNVFLTSGEGGIRVVLTDFGVARQHRTKDKEGLTASNVVLGTPTYMAPEQLELEVATPASDIYTLGLVIYELLTGENPFPAATPIQMVFKRMTEDPVPLAQHLEHVDPIWEKVIRGCLKRDPKQRFVSADEIVTLLGTKTDRGRGQRFLLVLIPLLLLLALAAYLSF